AAARAAARVRHPVLAGAALLAAGLGALALLPASSAAYAVPALAVCGAGFGLAVPPLTRASVDPRTGGSRSATLSVGARHAGLVLALVAIAPVLSASLDTRGTRATENAAAAVLVARLSLLRAVPCALELSDE